MKIFFEPKLLLSLISALVSGVSCKLHFLLNKMVSSVKDFEFLLVIISNLVFLLLTVL